MFENKQRYNTILNVDLTFLSFRKHAGQSLDADLELDVPNTKHLVLWETDQLTTTFDEFHLNYTCHVTPKQLDTKEKRNTEQLEKLTQMMGDNEP